MNFDFSAIKANSPGALLPKDLEYIYYNIAIDSLTGTSVLYDWNCDIEDFLSKAGLRIIDNRRKLPTEFEKDKIYIKVNDQGESKAMALFRHLRNAFAHYQIARHGEYFYMKDFNVTARTRTLTMIGQVKVDDLQQLCSIFFKQGEEYNRETSIIEEPNNNK